MKKLPLATLRLRGWKRCVWSVARSRNAKEYPSGRVPFARKGARCSCYVAPSEIERLGQPICHMHEAAYVEALRAIAARTVAARKRLDPGPVDL